MPLLPQTSLQDLTRLGQNHLHLETVWRYCCQGVYTKGIINVGQLNLSIQLQKTGASSFHIEEDAVIPLIKAGESWLRCIRTGCKSPPTHSPCDTYACQLKSITLPIMYSQPRTWACSLPPQERAGRNALLQVQRLTLCSSHLHRTAWAMAERVLKPGPSCLAILPSIMSSCIAPTGLELSFQIRTQQIKETQAFAYLSRVWQVSGD